MPRGGLRNPKGGRPLGSRDKIPRAAKDDERIKQFVAEVENAEFFVTDPQTKVYKGNSRELMVDIYKAEQVRLKYRMYAAAKMIEYEIVPPMVDGTSRPVAGEALVQAILKLKFAEDEPRGPPPQVIPPALPKPRVRPKPESPVIDAEAEAPSAEHGAKDSGKPRVGAAEPQPTHQSTHHSVPDGQPEPVHEITAEETAVISATPLYLRPGFGRRN